MTPVAPLRVAALVDLPRSAGSGGHVKCWERLAAAAAASPLPLDLTVYFSGKEETTPLSPHARIRQLPPVFSTSRLKFLSYVPDHTDLASYHLKLARELCEYDVLHTTDGFFAFAQTAASISHHRKIPLVTSFHTDTPAYTRIFTRQTLEKLFHRMPWLRRFLIETCDLPERQGKSMDRKLREHVSHCSYALVTRHEDQVLAESILGRDHVHHLRLGVDKSVFCPEKRQRTAIEQVYGIPQGRIVILFVGRVDVGKNIYTLLDACEKLIAEGVPLHLVVAGVGPATEDVRRRLKTHASVPGYVDPIDLARLYASVDGLALCSEVEIRSMAGVEAMASGCPVLVSKKSGIAELFDNTKAMRVVEGSEGAWSEALREFAKNPEQRDLMHKSALQYSQRHLASWQEVLAEDLFSVWRRASLSSQT